MVFASGIAHAQTLTVNAPSAAPNIGTVAKAASGDTVFRVTPGGAVTVQSGLGGRALGQTTVTLPVTVKCSGSSSCSNKTVYVKVQSGTASLPARALTDFTVSGSTVVTSSESGTNPLTFHLSPIPNNTTVSFTLGMDIGIAGSSTSSTLGTVNPTYKVSVGFTSSVTSDNDSGSAQADVIQPMSLSNTADLSFGRVVKPSAAGTTGSVSITANNAPIATNGVVILTPPSRAAYTVTGQPGQGLTITVPSSFTLTNGAHTITATTTGAPAGITALGTSGSYSFYVGGTMPVSDTTATGTYHGSYSVTVSYD